jgi:hypothetical protein
VSRLGHAPRDTPSASACVALLLLAGCAPPAPQGPPLLVPRTDSRPASTPRPITVQDTEVEVRVFEGDTPIVAVAIGAPEDATVERTLPGADHQMHTVGVTIGVFDADHSEQILIVRYETEGASFREVLRCPLKTVVQRFKGGRRLEIIVHSIPAPEVEPSPRETPTEKPTADKPADVWVIPPS